MRKEKTPIVVINNKQKKLVYFVERLGLIKIEGFDGMRHQLGGNPIGSFVYISGVPFVVNKIQKLFNKGFLISENGIDRKNFNFIAEIINESLEEADGM